MQRAEKLGLMATDEEVENKLNTVKAPYTKEEFDERLKDRKITLDDFRRDIRRSITIEKVVNKEISSKVNIVDADVTAYYTQHKAEFDLIDRPVPSGADSGDRATESTGLQPQERQGAKRSRCAQESADDYAPPRERRGFCRRGGQLQRAARDLGQWRRSWFCSRSPPSNRIARQPRRFPSSKQASTLLRCREAMPTTSWPGSASSV